MEDGVKEIHQGQYASCSAEKVVVSSSVIVIGKNAFSGWKSLKQVVFADDSELRSIEACAFEETGLEAFTAPKSLRVISQAAFRRCQSLASVELNEGLKVLGPQCF